MVPSSACEVVYTDEMCRLTKSDGHNVCKFNEKYKLFSLKRDLACATITTAQKQMTAQHGHLWKWEEI